MGEPQRPEFAIHIPKEEMKPRRLYLLQSRNLAFGVWNGEEGKFKGGFIGIRYKFGQARLDTEHHFDDGAPYGTARPVLDTGLDLPEGIELRESMPTIDRETKREVYYNKDTVREGDPDPRRRKVPGAWHFKDTGEYSLDIQPISFENQPFFEWLKEYEGGATEGVFQRQLSSPHIEAHYCVPGFPTNECPVCLIQETVAEKGPGKYWIQIQVRRVE